MHALHVRPPTVRPPLRFPLRTLVLMVLALVAWLHFFGHTHQLTPTRAHLLPADAGLKAPEKP